MEAQKITFMALWTLLSLYCYAYAIKAFGIYKKKHDIEYNQSESLFIAALFVSMAFVAYTGIGKLSTTIDTIINTQTQDLYTEALKASCLVTAIGFIYGVFCYLSTEFFTSILFVGKKQKHEFENNNIPYSTVRSTIMLVIIFTLSQTLNTVLEFTIPNDILPYR